MNKLNYWNETWSLDEAQCPCDLHFVRVPGGEEGQGRRHLPLRHRQPPHRRPEAAENGSNCAVLGITASPQEYDDYVELLIKNPRLGHTYKAYFGDIYQLDARLLPQFDYVSLFHVGEFRTPENDATAR